MGVTLSITKSAKVLGIVAASMAVTLPASAFADPADLPYGPDTCIQGLVWREARPGDTVCVTPGVRSRTAQENANRGANKDPNGAYGPESCAQGFVWREAFDGDVVCVTPAIRAENKAANAAAQSNYQRNQAPKAATASVTRDVDVYSVPDGVGKPIPSVFLKTGEKYTLAEPCRDNWCRLVIPQVPGGTGWVYQAGFLNVS